MLKIEIEFSGRAHLQTVLFEPGLCSEWRREIESRVDAKSFLAVVDANVARLYRLPAPGSVRSGWKYLWLRPGDDAKNLEQFVELADAALDLDIGPDTVVVGLGGGCAGDMAGLLASTLLGGLRLVLVPTTLLSQVDTPIGGNCGLNTRQGKNTLGTVRHADLVLIDSGLLETLPEPEFRNGLVEVVKTAMLEGSEFFEEVRASADLLASGNQGFLSGVIARCCRFKGGLIMNDPQGVGQRRLLALGHHFGHALETLAGFDGRVTHGEAVGVGLAMACDFAADRGMMSVREAGEVKRLLEKLRLPARVGHLGAGLPHPPDWERLFADGTLSKVLQCGNPVEKGRMSVVLPAGIGKCRVVDNVAVGELVVFFRRSL